MPEYEDDSKKPKRREKPAQRKPGPGGLILPVLPLRDAVLFPHTVMPLLVGRKRSLKLVSEAEEEKDDEDDFDLW